MPVYLHSPDNLSMFEKKNTQQFEKIGWYQMLSFWNKQTREMYKKNKIIDNLINNRDYSTLLELYKNDYNFTDKQKKNIYDSINSALLDRTYVDKTGIFELFKKYEIKVPLSHYYHFMISNSFNETVERLEKHAPYIENPVITEIMKQLSDNKQLQQGLHEFIVKDIESRPQSLGKGMNWAMSRDCYHQPLKYGYIFNGMTKSQLNRIIKTKIGTEAVIKEYQVLLSQALIDNNTLQDLGINTKSLVAKAQKEILLSEEGLTTDMKEKIQSISREIEKIQNNDKTEYIEQVYTLSANTLPNIIKKYLSIDEDYRDSLKNIQGKLPGELLMESLENIFIQVKQINQQINEEKITSLSVETRKLKK